jgi:hypothetical protein
VKHRRAPTLAESEFQADPEDCSESPALRSRPRDSVGANIERSFFELLLDKQVSGAAKHRIGRSFNWYSGVDAGRCFTCRGDRGISGGDFGCPLDPVYRLQKA